MLLFKITGFEGGGRDHKQRRKLLEVGKGKETNSPLDPPVEEYRPVDSFLRLLITRTIRLYIYVVLSHWICSNELQQQWEINTDIIASKVFPNRLICGKFPLTDMWKIYNFVYSHNMYSTLNKKQRFHMPIIHFIILVVLFLLNNMRKYVFISNLCVDIWSIFSNVVSYH